jgi:hypothetical protein
MLLKRGMQNPDVLNLERVIAALGFEGFEIDGYFDEKLENVIRYIQRAHNLTVDGIVGEKTLALLDRLYEPSKPNFSSSNHIPPADEKKAVASGYPEKLRHVHPILAEKTMRLIDLAREEGYELIVTQGLRTFAEQDRLFNQRPRVTNARGGQSYHNYGLAVDVAFKVNGQISWDERLYKNIGRWAARVGLEWGGNWRFVDLPHLQLNNLPSTRVLLAEYNAKGGGDKGVKAVWQRYVGY